MWRSWLAHLVWDQRVLCSSHSTPTIKQRNSLKFSGFLFCFSTFFCTTYSKLVGKTESVDLHLVKFCVCYTKSIYSLSTRAKKSEIHTKIPRVQHKTTNFMYHAQNKSDTKQTEHSTSQEAPQLEKHIESGARQKVAQATPKWHAPPFVLLQPNSQQTISVDPEIPKREGYSVALSLAFYLPRAPRRA